MLSEHTSSTVQYLRHVHPKSEENVLLLRLLITKSESVFVCVFLLVVCSIVAVTFFSLLHDTLSLTLSHTLTSSSSLLSYSNNGKTKWH